MNKSYLVNIDYGVSQQTSRSYPSSFLIREASQVKQWDEATIKLQNIDSLQLMERASQSFVRQIVRDYPLRTSGIIDVICGPGNNGGDGACLAILLKSQGYDVRVFGYWDDEQARSSDQQTIWKRLQNSAHSGLFVNSPYIPVVATTLIIDALFGIGLSRPLEGAFAKTVDAINSLPEIVTLSIDVPSGQDITAKHAEWVCVQADRTFTFGAYKYSSLFPLTGRSWGQILVLDIGLSQEAGDRIFSKDTEILIPNLYRKYLSPRPKFSHKGTWGHVLVIAGSQGHAGAALLAGRGAYRSGAGLVTFYVPKSLEKYMQLGLPEAMTLTDPHSDYLSQSPNLDQFNAVVVGPGIGTHQDTARMLAELFVKMEDKPLLVDADALNLLSRSEKLRGLLPSHCVLTPHPGEFARLVDKTSEGAERMSYIKDFLGSIAASQAVLVLKDEYTAVAHADGRIAYQAYFSNPGMGTGGTGDVLSGVIGAQLAAGLATFEAASLGVLMHAAAGDLAAADLGERGMLASDLADRLGLAAQKM